MYPNPVTDILYFDCSDTYSDWSIYNLSGMEVFKGGKLKDYLDLSMLDSGIYILYLTSDIGTESFKLVKN